MEPRTDLAEFELTDQERAALQAREPSALGRFYDLFFDRVYGYVYRLVGEEHLAEDVTQDVFMHLNRAFSSYDPGRPLRPWVFTIATNKVRDHWRSRRHSDSRREVSASGEDGEDYGHAPALSPHSGPGDQVESTELSRTIAEVIQTLPEISRTTLVLRYYEGLSFAEIGALIDRNETAVRKRYSRALEELRNRLAPILED